jgi:hypothetical protein
MIEGIRNSRALPVVKPSNNTVITGNKAGNQHAPKEETTLTFLERIEPTPSRSMEKGSIIDVYV